jgi:hypothetical protein
VKKPKRKLNGGWYKKGTALTYRGVLDGIEACLEGRNQWLEYEGWARAIEYENQAIGLIELLEVHNCGSIGGFDKGQPSPYSLEERWDWLVRKLC